MSLAVPPVVSSTTVISQSGYARAVALPPTIPAPAAIPIATGKEPLTEYVVKYDGSRQEVIFEADTSPVRIGDWVILTTLTGKYLCLKHNIC